MISMQCQIPQSPVRMETLCVQKLGFCSSVNHQGTSCETVQAQHYITLHEWKEGVNKYEVNLAKGSSRQLMCQATTTNMTQSTHLSTHPEPHFTKQSIQAVMSCSLSYCQCYLH